MARNNDDEAGLGRTVIEGFLSVDPLDVGCQQTWELIHVYAEVVAQGGDPEETMPGITAHLRSCPPCADDFEGLLNALMTADEVVARAPETWSPQRGSPAGRRGVATPPTRFTR